MPEPTEPNQTEEALRASELRYRRLFETAKDGILILDAKTGQITDVNPFMIDLLGYSYDEFIGTPLWEIGPFKDTKECKLAFLELQEKEYIRYESLPLETRDGRSIAVEFVSNVYGLTGGTRVIQCNIRNITKRKQAEDALHRTEEETRRFFEANPAGSYVASPDGRLITCNPAFARMLGFSSVEEAM
jgi:PAS domain S-box-containing protein